MRTFTIAELLTRIRAKADIEGTNAFVTDTVLQMWLDDAYAELVDLLARASIHFFETTATITTDGTNDSYALPDDHYKTLAVDYQYATNMYKSLEPVMLEERNKWMYGISGAAQGYRVIGTNIKLIPKPPSGQTYRHTYVSAPAKIAAVATTTNVDGVAGWEEYIVLHVARAVRMKQEDDAAVANLDSLLSRIRERIEEMAQDREPPSRIVDVNSDYDEFGPLGWRF